MWSRAPWCGEGRPGVDEDAWMPLERGGWRARFGGERLLRRESSESTSDTRSKMTRLALRGAPYAKTQGGTAAPGRPSLYPPLYPAKKTDRSAIEHTILEI